MRSPTGREDAVLDAFRIHGEDPDLLAAAAGTRGLYNTCMLVSLTDVRAADGPMACLPTTGVPPHREWSVMSSAPRSFAARPAQSANPLILNPTTPSSPPLPVRRSAAGWPPGGFRRSPATPPRSHTPRPCSTTRDTATAAPIAAVPCRGSGSATPPGPGRADQAATAPALLDEKERTRRRSRDRAILPPVEVRPGGYLTTNAGARHTAGTSA